MSVFTPKTSNISHGNQTSGGILFKESLKKGLKYNADKFSSSLRKVNRDLDRLDAHFLHRKVADDKLCKKLRALTTGPSSSKGMPLHANDKAEAFDLIFAQWQRAQQDLEASKQRETALQHQLKENRKQLSARERTINELQFKMFMVETDLAEEVLEKNRVSMRDGPGEEVPSKFPFVAGDYSNRDLDNEGKNWNTPNFAISSSNEATEIQTTVGKGASKKQRNVKRGLFNNLTNRHHNKENTRKLPLCERVSPMARMTRFWTPNLSGGDQPLSELVDM